MQHLSPKCTPMQWAKAKSVGLPDGLKIMVNLAEALVGKSKCVFFPCWISHWFFSTPINFMTKDCGTWQKLNVRSNKLTGASKRWMYQFAKWSKMINSQTGILRCPKHLYSFFVWKFRVYVEKKHKPPNATISACRKDIWPHILWTWAEKHFRG